MRRSRTPTTTGDYNVLLDRRRPPVAGAVDRVPRRRLVGDHRRRRARRPGSLDVAVQRRRRPDHHGPRRGVRVVDAPGGPPARSARDPLRRHPGVRRRGVDGRTTRSRRRWASSRPWRISSTSSRSSPVCRRSRSSRIGRGSRRPRCWTGSTAAASPRRDPRCSYGRTWARRRRSSSAPTSSRTSTRAISFPASCISASRSTTTGR